MARGATWALLLLAGTLWFVTGKDDWKRPVTEPTADAAYYYAYLPSLWIDGDLAFRNQYEVTKNWYRLGVTPTGAQSNVFGIGPAIFQTPAFVAAHAVAKVAGARSDGFSRYETTFVLWTSIPFTLGALLFAIRLARRRLGGGAAIWLGPALALVAGPVCYYAIRQPGYAHPYATFCVAWLVERWDASYEARAPRSMRVWIVLGLALGAATLARPQLAFWGLLYLPAAVDDVRRRGQVPCARILLRWGVGALVALLVFAPQLIAWKVLYGAWYVVPQGDGFLRWDAPSWIETLFSSRNGLFPWAPLYAPMLVGLIWVPDRWRIVPALIIGLLAQALVNGAAWDWWAGGSFGGRRFDSTYVVFALGAAVLVHHALRFLRAGLAAGSRWRQRALAAISAVGLGTGFLVAAAQLELAAKTSVVSARITGGEAAARVWRRSVGGVTGRVTGWLSSVVTAPVRLVFGVRHDVSSAAYDQLVGVHVLGETYPGLNAYPDAKSATIDLRTTSEPRFRGLVAVDARTARMAAPSARIFVGLNRRGSVTARMLVNGTGEIGLGWNGGTSVQRHVNGPSTLEVTLESPTRGVNWLELRAPIGTEISELELSAQEP